MRPCPRQTHNMVINLGFIGSVLKNLLRSFNQENDTFALGVNYLIVKHRSVKIYAFREAMEDIKHSPVKDDGAWVELDRS